MKSKPHSWYQTVVAKDYPIDKFFSTPLFLGSVEKDAVVIAYFDHKESVKKLFPNLVFSVITDSDWEEKWREFFRAIPFASFTVVPPWLKEQGNLIINPACGFGTGHHETTQLAAESLISILKNEDISTMLDVGTGSGILCISALMTKPALKIRGIDNDGDAIANAMENLELNNLKGKIPFSTSSVKRIKKVHDVVVANIISSVLLSMADELKALTGKYLIMSGVLAKERESFIKQMEMDDFTLIESGERGDWISFVFKRNNGKT